MSQRWESQLFDAIREGDERAFERLYDLYQQRVRLVAWRILHRPDWLDDILNESWCRAFAQRRDFDASRPFLVWMAGIVRNVYREDCRRSPLVLARDDTDTIPTHSDGESAEVSPEQLAADAELLAGVNECVAKLTSEDARIVQMRFFQSLSLREVGQIMGLAESTLRDVRIPAIYKSLRKCLESKGIRFSEVFPAQDLPLGQ